jgi:DNA-binding MurR/RpiR family transcriptional regulator
LASIIVNVEPDDLLFCNSYNGASREIIEPLETAERRETPAITLTSVPRSAAVKLSDTVLIATVRRIREPPKSSSARLPLKTVAERITSPKLALTGHFR